MTSKLAMILLLAACAAPTVEPATPKTAPGKPAGTTPAEDDESDAGEAGGGRFVGFDLHAKEQAKAAQFYATLFGWQVKPSADGTGLYAGEQLMARVKGPTQTASAGQWVGWLTTTDLVDTVRDVKANGGEVLGKAITAGGHRWQYVRGATGGLFGLTDYAGQKERDRLRPSESLFDENTIMWAQLWTRDFARAANFFSVMGNYDVATVTGKTRQFRILLADDVPRAVLVRSPDKQRSQWFPVVKVSNPQAVLEKARTLGATGETKVQTIEGLGTLVVLRTANGERVGLLAPKLCALKPVRKLLIKCLKGAEDRG